MRISLVAALILAALAIAGCGGSGSPSTTTSAASASRSAKRERLKEALGPILAAAHSPQGVAYETAVHDLPTDSGNPLDLRPKIEDLDPKMAAYRRYLQSLTVPACVRAAQRGIVHLLGESLRMDEGALTVMKTGDRDLVLEYLEKSHTLTLELKDSLEAEYKGDGHC
jgi:hypothetical protein